MEPMQAIIRIERGRILSVEPYFGAVIIISETGTETYPNAWALPGLTDSHGHILGLGKSLRGLNLYDARSANECAARAAAYTFGNGNWITGMGWNQELWEQNIYPTAAILDAVLPAVPVYLSRADGHAAWVNSEALRLAGLTPATPDPDGGTIMREKSGKPTGILIDNAMELVRKHIPPANAAEKQACIIAGLAECSRMGLTEVHDMDVSSDLFDFFRETAERGALSLRVQSFAKAQNNEWVTDGLLPAGGELFRICGLKFYADGALGSHGAALLDPYSDAQGNTGLLLMSESELFNKAKLGLEYDWHIATHAIGDAANRMVLNVYEHLREQGYTPKDAILRIEHAQIVHPDDIDRFSRHDIKAAVQPIHCVSDARMAEHRLGRRCEYAYPWRSLRNAGVGLAGGSDFPIESCSPLAGIDAFTRRIPFGESDAWFGAERITRQEAVLAYTIWAHEAAGQDYRRGFLLPKYDADITIMSENLLTYSEDNIPNIEILATYVAGTRKYHNDKYIPANRQ
ncbi:amidohydrolase [Ignavibacteria bacterium]|nr:amidohydrolase [Bacteroidota bacterium]MCZ2132361.1 amidohydrolase [Bacteroidota bacterium]